MNFQCPSDVFRRWSQRCEAAPQQWAGIGFNCQWELSGEGGGRWYLRGRGEPMVGQGACEEYDCQVAMSGQDFVEMARGELNPQVAFVEGRMRLSGEFEQVVKLNRLLSSLIDGI